MTQRHLKQIKTFFVNGYGYKSSTNLDVDVNNYVIKKFTETGNYPKIKTNSQFISVICDVVVDVKSE